MILTTLNPAFVKRFIDVYGSDVFLFLNDNIQAWIPQGFISNHELKLPGITINTLNKAVKDMLSYLLYYYKDATIHTIENKTTRAKIIINNPSDNHYVQYDLTRNDLLKRFVGDYETHLYKNKEVGKLSIKQLIKYYKYWFDYRNISYVFSFEDAEIIEKYINNLIVNGYTCLNDSKHIIYKRSAR